MTKVSRLKPCIVYIMFEICNKRPWFSGFLQQNTFVSKIKKKIKIKKPQMTDLPVTELQTRGKFINEGG